MSTRKRNEYLEGDESEDEVDNGDVSEEEGRGAIGSRATKRQRLETAPGESDDDEFHSFEDEEEPVGPVAREATTSGENASADRFVLGTDFEDDNRDQDDGGRPIATDGGGRKANKDQLHIPKSVAAAEKAARKSGVLYISRVPPFMKPQTLRHYLAPHAPKGLGRIFLTPEDHAAHIQRVKRGGNKKKSYTDGWVEFRSKTDAKIAAELLNGQIIGGKKGGFYYDDLWNVRYLKGFKWRDLTEQIANENAERAARLREEVRRTRRENKAFVEDVEKGKMLEGMERKEKAKQKRKQTQGDGQGRHHEDAERGGNRKTREFRQNKVKDQNMLDRGSQGNTDLQRVLGKIF